MLKMKSIAPKRTEEDNMIQHKTMIQHQSIKSNIIMNPSVSLFSTYIMSRYGFNSAAFRPVDLYFLELMGFELSPEMSSQPDAKPFLRVPSIRMSTLRITTSKYKILINRLMSFINCEWHLIVSI